MWSFEDLISSGKMGLEGPFEYAASRGIGAVEALDYYLKDVAGYALAARTAERLGIEVPCLTIVCDLSTGDAAFEAQRPYILEMLFRARFLGARYLRLLGGDDADEVGPEAAFARIQKNSLSLIGPAEEDSMTLVLENSGACLGRAADLRDSLRALGSDRLRANFDTANPLLAGEDPIGSFDALAGLISFVHLKDFRRAASEERRCQSGSDGHYFIGCPLGAGLVDIDALVAALRLSGYGGYLSVEYEGQAEDTGPIDLCIDHLLALV
ncbi:MAG: sugar phosphate isomerase/epimerase family protein [Rectinemataceae bacterium]|jgi:sugar phosphate isomerase/epimerase